MSQERSRFFRFAQTRLSIVLGLLMVTFGVLKFVSPTIDGWFHVQIQQSHLPESAILLGKIAEIMTGILFLLPWFRSRHTKWNSRILLIACSSLVLEMLVAVYVHLQPGVPPEVLPLGIKPPVISPIVHVGPDAPPTLQFVGEDDVYVSRIGSVQALHRRLREAGVASVCVEFPRTDHAFDLFLPTVSPAAQASMYDVDRFLGLMASPVDWKAARPVVTAK